jgi:1,4-dihydroxy-6-naphthoate synthase
MEYSRILGAVAKGEVDAGLIIHESRFTYSGYGLIALVDLGEWWERTTNSPIPLGAIVARRDLGDQIEAIDAGIRRSVEHALRRPSDSAAYVRAHAQELSPEVIHQHIGLYVNDFTIDVGSDGERAIRNLLERAAAAGLVSAGGRNQSERHSAIPG